MSNYSEKNSSKKWSLQSKIAFSTILVGTFLVLILPYLLSGSMLGSILLSNEGSTIGDTIGGITSPVVGIMNAILVYLALVTQIQANKEIRNDLVEQREDAAKQKLQAHYEATRDYIIEQRNFLKIEIDSFKPKSTSLNGIAGIEFIIQEAYKNIHNIKYLDKVERDLMDINHILRIVLDLVYNSEFYSGPNKLALLRMVDFAAQRFRTLFGDIYPVADDYLKANKNSEEKQSIYYVGKYLEKINERLDTCVTEHENDHFQYSIE